MQQNYRFRIILLHLLVEFAKDISNLFCLLSDIHEETSEGSHEADFGQISSGKD